VLQDLPPHPHTCQLLSWASFGPGEAPALPGAPNDGPPARHFFMVLENYPGGSVFEELAGSVAPRPLPEAVVCARVCDCALGLAHMHSQTPPMAHRDVKPENLLLRRRPHPEDYTGIAPRAANIQASLCDFGSVSTVHGVVPPKDIGEEEERINRSTTLAYRAPELCDLHGGAPVTPKVDVWALGCMAFQLCTRKTPFEDSQGNAHRMGVLGGRYFWPSAAVATFSDELRTLVDRMLTMDVATRPSAVDVLRQGLATVKAWPSPDTRPALARIISAFPVSPAEFKATLPRHRSEPLPSGAIAAAASKSASLPEVSAPIPPPQPMPGVGHDPSSWKYGGLTARGVLDNLQDRILQFVGKVSGRTTVQDHEWARGHKGGRAGMHSVANAATVHRWVLKATSTSAGSPKPKYVRFLVLDMWSRASARMSPVLGVTVEFLAARPVSSEPVVALKAVGLSMALLHDGPPAAAIEAGLLSPMFEAMALDWRGSKLPATDSPGARLALVSAETASMVTNKIAVLRDARKRGCILDGLYRPAIDTDSPADGFPTVEMVPMAAAAVASRLLSVLTSAIAVSVDAQRQLALALANPSALLKVAAACNIGTARAGAPSAPPAAAAGATAPPLGTTPGSGAPAFTPNDAAIVACLCGVLPSVALDAWYAFAAALQAISDCEMHGPIAGGAGPAYPSAATSAMRAQLADVWQHLLNLIKTSKLAAERLGRLEPALAIMGAAFPSVPRSNPATDPAAASMMLRVRLESATTARSIAAQAGVALHVNADAGLGMVSATGTRAPATPQGISSIAFPPAIAESDAAVGGTSSISADLSSDDEATDHPPPEGTGLESFDPFNEKGPGVLPGEAPVAAPPPSAAAAKRLAKHRESTAKPPNEPVWSSFEGFSAPGTAPLEKTESARTDDFPWEEAFPADPPPMDKSESSKTEETGAWDESFAGGLAKNPSPSGSRKDPSPTVESDGFHTAAGVAAITGDAFDGFGVSKPVDTSPVGSNPFSTAAGLMATSPNDFSVVPFDDKLWGGFDVPPSKATPTDEFSGMFGKPPAASAQDEHLADIREKALAEKERRRERARPHALARQLGNLWEREVEIEWAELELGPRIGSGGFAEVFAAEYRGNEVAVKRLLRRPGAAGEKAEEDFKAEVSLLAELQHPNIVAFIGVCPEPLALVTEFCSRGNLFDLLHNMEVELPWRLRVSFALDAARGMHFLHSRSPVIIHRDLKSLNLLVTESWRVKVSDFGLSRFKAQSSSGSLYTAQCGTFHWMAPEVIAGHRYTEKADVFSFGVNLWELLTRDTPYRGMQPMQVGLAVLHRGLRPRIPSDCPSLWSALMRACWRADPSRRPSFGQLVSALEKILREEGGDPATTAAPRLPRTLKTSASSSQPRASDHAALAAKPAHHHDDGATLVAGDAAQWGEAFDQELWETTTG
jgi:serine/threonine protein kinase